MTNTATDRAGLTAAGTVAWPRVWMPPASLLAVAAGAWVVTIIWARATGNGPGTMGLGLGRFVAMWALMMTAMMLPSAVRVARPGLTTSPRRAAGQGQGHEAGETFVFAAGYLLVWAATGVPAFGAAVAAGRLADHHPAVATGAAVAIFALAGLYQFTAAKRRSLEQCRVLFTPGGSPTKSLREGARTAAGAWRARGAPWRS